ncbi:MAG TPA: hypothetical protein VNY30_03050, partial [Bryobacteraceae bacterium]|nr:hypothetical protein [Bryobacteraceae bacterium]
MNSLNGLTDYLQRIERRLRMLAVSRGVAMAALAALAFTVAGALAANYFAFSSGSVFGARLVLFLALAAALGTGLILPLLRLNRRNAAQQAEHQCPQFEQRLVTFAERVQTPDPFLELLAADTLDVARDAQPERIAPGKRIWSFASAGLVSLAALLWLGTSGPGFLGYGTSLLWGAIPRNQMPFYELQVQPGDHTIRRKSDQLVTARPMGFQTNRVRVFAKFQSSSKWEEALMSPQSGTGGFEFLFAGIPEAFDYYAEAGGVRSKQYRMNVVDLPAVKKLRVTYHYPGWTGMKDTIEDPGGDLRAVQGTEAEVKVETDQPLSNGALLLDDGSKFELRDGVARLPLQKDGVYHVATAVEHGDMVRLSNDYFIEVRTALPPSVRITRPGRDAKVNPIEEVTVTVNAKDDFGLRGMEMHYSVNGGKEKTVDLGGKSGKAAEGSSTIYLEDHKLVPGDIVTFYATARNGLTTSRSDMFFIEAQPFERDYSQSQQMGGGGGGDQNPQVAEHQKDIVSATWNQIKNESKNKTEEQENARMLAGIQSKLREQAKSLAERMGARDLGSANPAFKSFADDMAQAIEAMGPAIDKLRAGDYQDALAPEQKSLQYLSRAEATFRDIQVAFGNQGGGGAGGAGRDLEGLFDLELDREKNQFESGQKAASPSQRQKEIEESLAKLEELARRQQELANQQKQNQQAYQQRWQQEMLRREAEELRRKMEQLARSQSSAQGQQGQQGQESRESQGQRGQQGRQSSGGQASALNRAIERLAEAARDMQNAGNAQNQGTPQSEAEARHAAERLREAREMLAGERRQQAGEQVEELARKTQQLAEEQKNFEQKMRQTLGGMVQDEQGGQGRPSLLQQPGTSRRQTEPLQTEEKKLIEELTQIEKDMQKAARDMAASQPSASGKLRDALAEAQKQDLGMKMGWSVEVMRQGYAPYALTRQPAVTEGLNQLRDRVREAQGSMNRDQAGGNDLEAALGRAEQLREQLEQLKRQGPGQQGRQGDQQGKQSGQQQPGQQPGGQQPSPNGTPNGAEPGGQTSDAAEGRGGVGSQAYGGPGLNRAYAEGALREGIRDLTQLDQMIRGNRDI